MRKSGYVFFGIIIFFMSLIPVDIYIISNIKQAIAMQDRNIAVVEEIVNIYLENQYPNYEMEIQTMKYSVHAEQYLVNILKDDDNLVFLVYVPKDIDKITAKDIHDTYPRPSPIK